MEAITGGGSVLQFTSSGVNLETHKLVGFNHRCKKQQSLLQSIDFDDLKLKSHTKFKSVTLYCHKDSQRNFGASSDDGNWLLKMKGKEIASCLYGRSIYLVGMMGSGKTTVGKILSEALGYTFMDSDECVEQATGATSVAEIFKQWGESFFREYETEAFKQLSMMTQQVVATGGGAVIRPINWRYMRQGISVFLDVPLDALARRIAAVGTDTRPLLCSNSGDAYTKVFTRLLNLSKKRSEAYANADATVSLPSLAASLQLEDVLDLTPTAIAIEVLLQIEKYQRGNYR